MGFCFSRLEEHQVLPTQDNACYDATANATVVVNVLTLEVAVEDINTQGEAKGLKTAHETLLEKTGWRRACCFGGAVQAGMFPPVSGFINGHREGYKAMLARGYDGQLSAYGKLETDHPSEDLNAFKKFTKQKENREKAQVPQEAVDVALGLPASGEDGFKQASFSMDRMLQAESLEYFSSFSGGVEDASASKDMLQKVLKIEEDHYGADHPYVAGTLLNLSNFFGKLEDHRTEQELLERALNIMLPVLGEDHHLVALTLSCLGRSYFTLDDIKAEEILERALKIQEKHYGREHLEMVATHLFVAQGLHQGERHL